VFDVGAPELLVLIVIAVILFGPEKLPEFARKAARLVRYLRSMAGNAQQQLSKELGPGFDDVDVRDLNPKTFIQKHLLDDVEPVIADVKKEITTAKTLGGDAADDVTAAVNSTATSPNGSTSMSANGSTNGEVTASPRLRSLTPFDPDAT
jgi:sec-independent protein translocase protein TatB